MQLPFISLPRARALTAVIAGLGCAAPALATLDVEAMALFVFKQKTAYELGM